MVLMRRIRNRHLPMLPKLAAIWFIVSFLIPLSLSGCGSSTENPSAPSKNKETEPVKKLTVNVEASRSSVFPGDTVKLTATVESVRAETVNFNWINVTGFGTMTPSNNTALWTAPSALEKGTVKVEVIQLVATAISRLISVGQDGVNTKTEIFTDTATVPITIIAK